MLGQLKIIIRDYHSKNSQLGVNSLIAELVFKYMINLTNDISS